MTSFQVRLVAPLLLLVGSFCSTRIRVAGDSGDLNLLQRGQREFDYFKLALQWPGTGCNNTKKCCSSNGCCRSGAITGFTIHGLWAEYNDGTWPSCCQEKHGTCSYPVVENESDFFSTALNIYFKYNVTEALFKAGYAPSNSEKYPLGGIISAIQNAFYMTPEVVCSGEALKELRLCFYKNFEPRDCATESRIESGMISLKTSSCPSYVSLPVHEASQCNRLMDWISLKLSYAVSVLVYLSMRRG